MFTRIGGLVGGRRHRDRGGPRASGRPRGALAVRRCAADVPRGGGRAGHRPPAHRVAEDGLTCRRSRRSLRGGVITGWGTALPDKVVTNDDLATMLDTTDEWILERTGIRERRVGGTTSGLAVESGRAALASAGVDPTAIDVLVLATTTPDQAVPATSAAVQDALGLRCGAFDLNAACSGFVYALVAAHGLIGAGAQPDPGDRHRHAVARSPTGTTAARPSCSPTAPAPSCSRPSRGRASCSAGTSTPTGRSAAALRRPRRLHRRWTARRSSGGPCASWSTRPRSR